MFYRGFLVSVILLIGIFSEPARADVPTPEEQAKALATPYRWHHLGIAVVGLSSNDNPMLRRISLGVVIPRLSVEVAQQQRVCVDKAFDELGATLTKELDGFALRDEKYDPSKIEEPDSSDAVELHLSTWALTKQNNIRNYINATSAAIEEATNSFRRILAESKGCSAFEKTSVLILLQRVCPLDSKDNCGFDSKNFTQDKKTKLSLPNDIVSSRFDKLVQWGNAVATPKAQPDPRTGLLLPDNPVAISANGDLGKEAAAVFANLIASKTLQRVFSDNDPFDPESLLADQQIALEKYFEKISATKISVASGVFLVSAVPAEIAVRLSNLATIRDPTLALNFLPSRPLSKLLKIKLDPATVARLRECTQFRATPLTDIKAIEACTGYKFESVEQVLTCLKGDSCAPPILNLTPLAVAHLTGELERKVMAIETTIPRLTFEKKSFDQILTLVKTNCEELMPNSGGKKLTTDFASCVLARSNLLQNKVFTSLKECKEANKAPIDIAQCLAKLENKELPLKEINCVLGKTEEKGTIAKCLFSAQLGEKEGRAVACLMGESAMVDGCISDALGKNVKVVETCAKILADEKDRFKQSVECAKLLKIKIPPEAEELLSCASQYGGDATLTAGCVVSGKIKGDARFVAECFVQSNGDPTGTAVCFAGRHMGLNADWQIAVQCATTSGGEPVSTATCTFGRLTLREMTFCKGKNFGEGKCFGNNNTIRKALNIGKNSVVADLINFKLKILNAQISIAEGAVEVGKTFVTNFERELKRIDSKVTESLEKGYSEARKLAKSIGGGGDVVKIVSEILPKIKF